MTLAQRHSINHYVMPATAGIQKSAYRPNTIQTLDSGPGFNHVGADPRRNDAITRSLALAEQAAK
jgi:hypothetical protein